MAVLVNFTGLRNAYDISEIQVESISREECKREKDTKNLGDTILWSRILD